jgi:NAD(P)-dependent dehydrogenase (short-subunit alcohol dehydrogenase family)
MRHLERRAHEYRGRKFMAMGRLDDKVAVVTGGGGLIGSAVAALLANYGARVAVVDIVAHRAEAVAREIAAADADAIPFTADIADEHAVAELFQEIEARFAGVDALVNCAAPLGLVREERPLAELSVPVWDDMMRIAVRGTMLCSRAALQLMIAAGSGSIVNVSSIHAFAGDTSLVAYPAAKAAIVALTRSTATQYGRHGVRCNVVCPGTIPPSDTDASVIERRVRHQAIGRPGVPRDVADAVAFLVSDESSFITGQALTVDGGVLMHLPSYAEGGNVPPS